MTTTVRIPWQDDRVEYSPILYTKWNEICARAIEQFGLPGDRFTTYVNSDFMDFIFNSEQDALIFSLEHSGKIVSKQQQAMEAVSKFL